MSALDTARRLIEARYEDGRLDPRNDGTDLIIHSVAMAALAVAEEQRTANLIAVAQMQWSEGRKVIDLRDQIFKRLGLWS